MSIIIRPLNLLQKKKVLCKHSTLLCEKSSRLLWAACAVLLRTRSLTDPEPNETRSPQLALWEKCRVTLQQEKSRGQKMTNMGNFDNVEYFVLTPLSLGFSPLFFALTFSLPFLLFLPLSFLLRTSRMTTPDWSTMWMQITASPWKVIFLRGPAMLSRRGIGLTHTFPLAPLWIH